MEIMRTLEEEGVGVGGGVGMVSTGTSQAGGTEGEVISGIKRSRERLRLVRLGVGGVTKPAGRVRGGGKRCVSEGDVVG